MREKIKALRHDMGGIDASRETERGLEKQIKILENRLEKAYRTYSERATKNRRLREMIDNFRRERLMLQNIDLGLEKENGKLKRDMTKTVKRTKAIHDTRDSAQVEMANLKTRIEKLQAGYEKEWAELTAIIEQDKETQEQKRLQEMEDRERKTQELLHSGQNTEERRGVGEMRGRPMDKQLQARSDAMEKLQRFTVAFEQIQKATGAEDMEAVMHRIADAEDTNFTLFNFVNELGKDIERLRLRIQALTAELSQDDAAAATTDGRSHDRTPPLPVEAATVRVPEGEAKKAALIVEKTRALMEMVPSTHLPSETGADDIAAENVELYLGCVAAFAEDLAKVDRREPLAQRTESLPTHFSISAPSTQAEELDGLGAELFDDEKPAFGETLRSNVTKTMQRRSSPSTADAELRLATKSTKRRF